MRVLIVDSFQSPPAFIRNLIQGLLDEGLPVALLGKARKDAFVPVRHSQLFTRVISGYRRFNIIFFVVSFLTLCLTAPGTLRKAHDLYARSGDMKLDLKRWLTMARILQFRPSVIHIQWPSALEEFGKVVDRGVIKTVVSLRGRQINVTPAVFPHVAEMYRRFFPNVSFFHAVSRHIGGEAVKYGADPSKIKVIYSPVPESFFNAFDAGKSVSRSPLRIISLGRFHWMKGYVSALEAFSRAIDVEPGMTYTIIAPGIVPDDIWYAIHDLDLVGHVRIVKGIPHSSVISELQAHSVLLLPSVKEGVANVVLEAMAVGLPVISTDCGGMNEVVADGETGLLVAPRNVQSMADAIIRFARMKDDQINTMRKRAWEKVRSDFYATDQMKEFVRLYQSLS